MTLDDIKKAVAEIEEISDDDETAHAREDDLFMAFINHVARSGPPELAEMASEVLKTQQIGFARWCA